MRGLCAARVNTLGGGLVGSAMRSEGRSVPQAAGIRTPMLTGRCREPFRRWENTRGVVSEEYAERALWCPMVRARWRPRVVAFNRVNRGHDYRLLQRTVPDVLSSDALAVSCEMLQMLRLGLHDVGWERPDSPRGYCGLAGSPLLAGLPDEEPESEDLGSVGSRGVFFQTCGAPGPTCWPARAACYPAAVIVRAPRVVQR